MIDRKKLLADLQALLRKEIEPDLRKRSDLPEIAAALKAEFDKAKKAKRTAINYTDWRADTITQIGVAWVLSCVFIRFLEDNRLVDPPRLSGPTEVGESHSALQRARDEYDLHIQTNPEHSFRQYILSVIDDLAKLPGGKEVFGKNNIIHQHRDWLSNDAAKSLYNFWQKIEPTTGDLVHDFTDDADEGQPFDTRFLGDLYQDLSEAARKKYALLQTPDFVEAFILDRTLEPALDEFGLEPKPPEGSGLTTNTFRMIDPACGSGHFLLGAFDRILERWQRKEPGTKIDVLVERTLASIYGVDVNPFAVAIARFRLLIAAFRACHVTRLNQPIEFQMNVACGDSLYHGVKKQQEMEFSDQYHYFQTENAAELARILQEGKFHAVVANPPYIVPKDKASNQSYRAIYMSCHRQYSLAVPFMERIFRLAVNGAGYTGQITANSFMKREFGKKLIEQFLPSVDLTHVIDTSGAYIPGHGTPTVILLGRNRSPINETIRTAMGIQGEPSTPREPSEGFVWSAVIKQIDIPDSKSDFISVGDSSRELFQKHPWSIGGGGASELKEHLDSLASSTLDSIGASGIGCITGEDNCLVCPKGHVALRNKLVVRDLLIGDVIRDWSAVATEAVLWPNDEVGERQGFLSVQRHRDYLWPYRPTLKSRLLFSVKVEEKGIPWWALKELYLDKYRTHLSIVFAFVSTHNHFVLDRGGRAFKQSSPVIKIHGDASESDYIELLGVLNSSTSCFWIKQVSHNKGSSVDQHGARQTTIPFENFWEHDSTKLKKFPLPKSFESILASELDRLSRTLVEGAPQELLKSYSRNASAPLRQLFGDASLAQSEAIRKMVAMQEELDWTYYNLYKLVDDDLAFRSEIDHLSLSRGQRAFEIVMARKMAAGELETTWFERHGSTPITELPEEWPDDYKALVNRRIEVIESNPNIALIEQPEYKRRWNTEPWDSQVERALREWMLLRLESYFDFDGRMNDEGQITAKFDIGVTTVAKLADVAFKDAQFKEVAEVYRGRADFDPVKLIDELVADEHVPALPILRYKPAGLDKRAEWENTWQLQRIEDRIHAEVELICRDALTEESAGAITPDQPLDPYKAILNVNKVDFKNLAEAVSRFEPTAQAAGVSTRSEPAADIVGSLKNGFAKSKLGTLVDLQRLVTNEILGEIPVPPKYTSGDFISTGGAKYWKLRGKLDVPKERWVSLPHCQGEDQTLPIAWAGYDHLQLLQAIAAYFAEVQQLGGSDDPRLVPLLAAMDQQIPWVKQWHNDTDNEYGYALGDFFEDFIATEARNLGLTLEDVRVWTPPERAKKKAIRKSDSAS